MDEMQKTEEARIEPRLAGKNTAEFSWKHLMIRCGSPDCSLRLKLQPRLFTRFRGIRFRNHWYHDTACLREALVSPLKQMLLTSSQARNRSHRFPLGLLLVKRGVITPGELREALHLQRQAGTGKLGYWLRQITAIDEEQICAALGQQWGCPVFPLDLLTSPAIAPNSPPYPLLAAAGAVPAFATTDGRQWHIAFSDHIDHTLLFAMEDILGCQTYPCVSRESVVREKLEQIRKHMSGNEICFDSVRDPAEMAATICSYSAQMDVRELKVVRAAGYIWVAFFRGGARRDLLFRLPSGLEPRKAEPLPGQTKGLPVIADTSTVSVFDAPGPL